VLGAGNATLTNSIGRNVNADVERLRLETGAKVNGDLKYASRDAMYLADGAAVAGQTVRTERTHNEDRGGWEGFGAWMGIYMIVSLLLIALAAALLIPRVPHRISDVALRDPLKAGVVGLVAGVLFPILFVSLLFTVIGIPLALFLALVWLAILAAGLLSFSYYLGRLVWKAQRNPLLIMLVGALIFLVVLLVPFLGGLAIFIATCMGTGMVLIKLRDQIRRPIDDRPATKPALHKS
jgi:MFS family permease